MTLLYGVRQLTYPLLKQLHATVIIHPDSNEPVFIHKPPTQVCIEPVTPAPITFAKREFVFSEYCTLMVETPLRQVLQAEKSLGLAEEGLFAAQTRDGLGVPSAFLRGSAWYTPRRSSLPFGPVPEIAAELDVAADVPFSSLYATMPLKPLNFALHIDKAVDKPVDKPCDVPPAPAVPRRVDPFKTNIGCDRVVLLPDEDSCVHCPLSLVCLGGGQLYRVTYRAACCHRCGCQLFILTSCDSTFYVCGARRYVDGALYHNRLHVSCAAHWAGQPGELPRHSSSLPTRGITPIASYDCLDYFKEQYAHDPSGDFDKGQD